MSARLQPGRDAVPAVAEQPRRSPRHVVSAPCRRAPGREAGRPMLCAGAPAHGWRWAAVRSEEHTSELQSLMRISYAVFCLKKKKQKRRQPELNTIMIIRLYVKYK